MKITRLWSHEVTPMVVRHHLPRSPLSTLVYRLFYRLVHDLYDPYRIITLRFLDQTTMISKLRHKKPTSVKHKR